MSKSKRQPYAVCPGAAIQKRLASRRFRRRIRSILNLEKKGYLGQEEILIRYFLEWSEDEELIHLMGDDEPEFPHPKWMTNPYTVRDFRFYSPRDKREYRK